MSTQPSTVPSGSPLLAAAQLLVTQDPNSWRRLMAAHTADAGGRCRACRSAASGAAPVWPCGLAVIAELAERLDAARRPEAAQGG